MTRDKTAHPENWPEQYSAAGRSPQCPHQMHWDDADGVYRCIHDCGEVDETPPERYVDTEDEPVGAIEAVNNLPSAAEFDDEFDGTDGDSA